MMRIGILAAILLAVCASILAQPTISRATVQQSLGFEDQSSAVLTGWDAKPPDTISADDHIVHTGHWSVRLQRDSQSADGSSFVSRKLPVDFRGRVVELRGYLRLQNVSGNAGLVLEQDLDGQPATMVPGNPGERTFENMDLQHVTGTRGWAQYRVTVPIHPRGPADNLWCARLRHGHGVGRRP